MNYLFIGLLAVVVTRCQVLTPYLSSPEYRRAIQRHDSIYHVQTDSLLRAHPDGIAALYKGRQIGRLAGHGDSTWLERNSREREERTDLLLQNIKLQANDVVVEVGAGTGYLTIRIAPIVKRLYAVETHPVLAGYLKRRVAKQTYKVKVKTDLGRSYPGKEPIDRSYTGYSSGGLWTKPLIRGSSVNLVVLLHSYHEVDYPVTLLSELYRILKPNGRLAVIEYQAEDPTLPIPTLHRMSKRQIRREMVKAGFYFTEEYTNLPHQYCLIFRRPTIKDIYPEN